MKESEEESDLGEDDVFEICSCSCDEKACYSDIGKDDLKTIYVGIDQADSLCRQLIEPLLKQVKFKRTEFFTRSSMMSYRQCTIRFIRMTVSILTRLHTFVLRLRLVSLEVL